MPQRKLKFLRRAAAAALAAALVLGGALLALRAALPDTFAVEPGQTLHIASLPFLHAEETAGPAAAPADAAAPDRSSSQKLSVFGIPIKTVRTVAQARRTVTLGGAPFGVKMFTDGALVVAFSDIYTALGRENPAKEAGLRLGDLITQANGTAVRTNEELTAAIAAADGAPVRLTCLRGDRSLSCTLTPVQDRTTGGWRAGIWVRDSSAGIGTLTFCDAQHGTFAGLGHAVSDTDTGADLTLLSGEAVAVTITGLVRGTAGSPGELKGSFGEASAFGDIKANDSTGVYGVLTASAPQGESAEVANVQEVHTGDAEILTTLDGTAPRRYAARIERVNMTSADPNRNLLLRITDEELLEQAGGIVQGMSGSPILQDGRLVGAVTHVLVNDPTRGYGIFAATMLARADTVG